MKPPPVIVMVAAWTWLSGCVLHANSQSIGLNVRQIKQVAIQDVCDEGLCPETYARAVRACAPDSTPDCVAYTLGGEP